MFKMIIPGRCGECGGETGHFYVMEKGGKCKFEVCDDCAKKLEKEGWKIEGRGMH